MVLDSIQLASGEADLRANTASVARFRIDLDNGDYLWRDHGGTVRRITEAFRASVLIGGAAAATAANYGIFFVASAACRVTAIVERHETAGGDAGAVTVMVKKVPSGTAKASGTDLLSAGISLKATADTNQAGTLATSTTTLSLAAGDALALVTTGVLTSVAGVAVSVALKKIA